MSALSTVTLLVNGLTLALALGFLLIVLWNNPRKELNQFFAIFLLLVTFWNTGAFLAQAAMLVAPASPLVSLALSMMELGFTGSSIAVYVLTAVLVRAYSRRFRLAAFASLLLVVFYRLLLLFSNAPTSFQTLETGDFSYRSQPLSIIFYAVFDTATLYLVWRNHRKIKSRGLKLGLVLFVVGQTFGFLNPDLQAFSVSLIASSLGALVVSFALLRQEIIDPLAERVAQVESMHKVSLAITSQLAIDTVLNQIATQAAAWLSADAAGIFLAAGDELELAAVYNLPPQFVHVRLHAGQGVAGTVARTRQSVWLDNYAAQWKLDPDLPLAQETFGSVICTPLIYGGDAIGVLIVIAGRHGKLFQRDDVRLLELLGSQAAVAIAHSRLFAEQDDLTRAVEAARSQLETVLASSENAVIAVDRQFRLIFANPAARALFSIQPGEREAILNLLPASAFPRDPREGLRHMRRGEAYTYEVALHDREYLCHIARLGDSRAAGWVAVLNDVTELKELDRIKSEMVRMTSHDLKNPLQAALANLDLLRDDLDAGASADAQHSIAMIEKQLERMNRIISGILDLERVKSGARMIEPCLPERLVMHTVDELGQLAQDHDVRVVTDVQNALPPFMGDYAQFQRALINLVENAIKFTPSGGVVTVRAYRDESTLIFSVQDTGVGIAPELRERIFDRFFRGKQKGVEHVSGSGLGLSLVKAVVENHAGEVWLESGVGMGTTFYIRIPLLIRNESSVRYEGV